MNQYTFDFYYGMEAEQFHFYRIPRALIKDPRFKSLSCEAKLLYGLLLDRMSLSMKNRWLDQEDRVYIIYPAEEIMEDLNCSKNSCTKFLAELDEAKGIGLIKRKRQGLGKPDIIYVKNFISIQETADEQENTAENKEESAGISESQKMGNRNPEAKTSRIPKNGNQDSQDLGTNYTNNNYTENNYTQSVSQSENLSCVEKETGQDVTDRTYAYIELVKSNIAYDSYMSDPTFWYKDLYEELFMTICDVVCVPRDTMRIGGRLYPYSIVQSQFLKLTNEHLEYVLGKMEQNTSEIKNINAYLVTALYNASISMNYSVAQSVRHDMTHWSEEQKI